MVKELIFDFISHSTGASLKECLLSWYNLCLIYQVSITMLVLWYFIANIDKYLAYITDQSTGLSDFIFSYYKPS